MSGVEGGGLRKRRTGYFVQVPRETIRDKNLSWKARGLLTYLLDMPDGWDVRSEFLAGEGPDGKDSVQTGLRELRTHGYYRLERRRLRDGTLVMGTAISEVAVAEWAAENEEFDGKPVLCIEQSDGGFMVRHKDGSMTSDGFDSPSAEHEDTTGAGFSGSGESGAGSSDSGESDAGESRPYRETEKGDPVRETETEDPASTTPPTADADGAEDALPGLPADVPNVTVRSKAEVLTKAWHDHYVARYGPIVSWRHVAVRNMVEGALHASYTEAEIKHALQGLATPVPSAQAFQRAITDVHAGRPVNRGNLPQPQNVHHNQREERKRSW